MLYTLKGGGGGEKRRSHVPCVDERNILLFLPQTGGGKEWKQAVKSTCLNLLAISRQPNLVRIWGKSKEKKAPGGNKRVGC